MTKLPAYAHPALQLAITDWMERRLPEIHFRLERRIETLNGDYLTVDEVAYRMTNAAMEVLEMALSAAGILVDTDKAAK